MVERSLIRLGVDAIDLYYQHRVNPEVPTEEFAGAVQRKPRRRWRGRGSLPLRHVVGNRYKVLVMKV